MMRRLSFGLVLAALSLPAVSEAQDTQWNRYTLEDLGGVFVRIEANDVCTSAGVTAAAFQADVSLKLIEAEVGVLTLEEMLSHQALPELRISMDCATGMSGAMGFSVSLRVQQSAQMLRDTQITLPEAVTWFTTTVGVASEGGAADTIGEALMAGVDQFAEAWAAVNAETDPGR